MAIFSIDLSSLDGTNGFRLDGSGSELESGKSVSTAGDVNGDGFDDVIIDAPGGNYGLSYVVFGRASGFDAALNLSKLNGSDGFRLDGERSFSSAWHSVGNAGDVNGDGFGDVIIGAAFDGTSGSSYVVFGRASGFSAVLDLSSLDGSNGFRVDGLADGGGLGRSVSTAGDVNGDGFYDVIVGAFLNGPNGDGSGSSYVILGRASGFDATMDLSSLDGSNGFRLDGAAAADYSGSSVSGAGDVNGDGLDDLMVGAHYADSNGIDSGSSYVVFGRAAGFDATMDLSSLDGSNGFRLDGVLAGDSSGFSVSNAGDVNGDSFDDVIVGAFESDSNGMDSGSSYVVFGRASGFDAAMDLSSLDGSNGFRLDGVAAGDILGFSVSNAGNINGDSFDDLLIGAHGADPNGDGSGSSYVVFGRASGFDATMDLSSLDGDNGFRVDGLAFSSLGYSVSAAGDVNDDGFDDLMAGAPLASPNGARSGSSFVIFGSRHITGTLTYVGTPGDDVLTGTSAAEIFEAANGNDIMTGGGGADVFRGSSGDDTMQVADLNFQLVDGGFGTDTLSLGGSELNLDLASFSEKIQGIEAVDLTGSGNNTLNLTAINLFGLSDTSDTLVVNGNAGDRVTGLNGGWMDGGIQGGFHAFTQGTATLLVDAEVNTDPPAGGVINLSSLNGNNGFRLDGVAENDFSGQSVSNAGDVNGDGFDDLIIGASSADPSGDRSGSSYVVFGKAAGFDAAMDLSALNGSNGFRLDGAAEGDSSGFSVSNAGDVNGDGFDDVIIGAPSADPSGDRSGSSYVVFGKASGFDASMDLSSLNGSNGFRLDGEAAFDYSGRSVSAAGDVNGDGFDDVIISRSTFYDGNSIPVTVGYVVLGKPSGFSPILSLSDLDGSNGFHLDVDSFYSNPSSLSSAGDVNGDGFDDLIVGINFATYSGGHFDGIASYVVFGKASGFDAALNLSNLNGSDGFRLTGARSGLYDGSVQVSSAGDINGDGFDDLMVGVRSGGGLYYSGTSYVVFGKADGFSAELNLLSLDGSNGFRLDGLIEFGQLGNSVSGAGDVNGDGFDDLIVGAHGANSSYVVFGKSSGFDATVNLSALDGSNGARLDGGSLVSSAGDVNGDGFDDLIVGSPGATPNGVSSGSSYIIFGRSDFRGLPEILGTTGDDILKGTSAAEHFKAGDGNDKLIGRGGADRFDGGAGNDKIQVADLSFALVDGGAGIDVLHLAGTGLNLNLADSGDRISGIEIISLYSQGDRNTLTLTAADLRDLSNTTNTLKVNGNAGGHIIVEDGGWIDGGPRGSGYYHEYMQGDAVLLVGQNLTVDFVAA